MRPVGRWITRGRADMGGAAGWLGRQRPALAGWLLLRPRAAASLGSGGALHSTQVLALARVVEIQGKIHAHDVSDHQRLGALAAMAAAQR